MKIKIILIFRTFAYLDWAVRRFQRIAKSCSSGPRVWGLYTLPDLSSATEIHDFRTWFQDKGLYWTVCCQKTRIKSGDYPQKIDNSGVSPRYIKIFCRLLSAIESQWKTQTGATVQYATVIGLPGTICDITYSCSFAKLTTASSGSYKKVRCSMVNRKHSFDPKVSKKNLLWGLGCWVEVY